MACHPDPKALFGRCVDQLLEQTAVDGGNGITAGQLRFDRRPRIQVSERL